MSYSFWDKFVSGWLKLPISEYTNAAPGLKFQKIQGWDNPNLLKVYGTLNQKDFSLQYLPEPWWGNNGISPLESVIINYNPAGLNQNYYGKAANQHIQNAINLYGFNSYSAFIQNEVLNKSNRFPGKYQFHYTKRASRVFLSLNKIGIPISNNSLENHLSIELAPWYAPKTSLILPYIMKNIGFVYLHCILFAADQSKRIQNQKLKNKVIIRTSEKVITPILKNLIGGFQIKSRHITKSGDGCIYKFSINTIIGVEFMCIWGPKSRNDFPPIVDLDEIFLNYV